MERNFNDWFSCFKNSISDYKYYVDFEKVYESANEVKIELNILNSLVGTTNIEEEFKSIIIRYPETLKCIPLLLAVRSNEIYVKDENKDYTFKFDSLVYSIDDYIKFMWKSGLFDLISKHIINNLYDYCLGTFVGLDSNARKNRGGDLMEDLVESYIIKAGYIKDVNYFKEVTTDKFKSISNIDILSLISNVYLSDKIANKRFDFVIVKDNHYYLIETNFYASSGSKLNETARSYKMLSYELSSVKNVSFIWITDGIGWSSARGNLEETFNALDTLYNINDLESGVLEDL